MRGALVLEVAVVLEQDRTDRTVRAFLWQQGLVALISGCLDLDDLILEILDPASRTPCMFSSSRAYRFPPRAAISPARQRFALLPGADLVTSKYQL